MTYISIEKTSHTGSTITLGEEEGAVEKTPEVDELEVLARVIAQAHHHHAYRVCGCCRKVARAVADHVAKGRKVDEAELKRLWRVFDDAWNARAGTNGERDRTGIRAVLREVGVEVGE